MDWFHGAVQIAYRIDATFTREIDLGVAEAGLDCAVWSDCSVEFGRMEAQMAQ